MCPASMSKIVVRLLHFRASPPSSCTQKVLSPPLVCKQKAGHLTSSNICRLGGANSFDIPSLFLGFRCWNSIIIFNISGTYASVCFIHAAHKARSFGASRFTETINMELWVLKRYQELHPRRCKQLREAILWLTLFKSNIHRFFGCSVGRTCVFFGNDWEKWRWIQAVLQLDQGGSKKIVVAKIEEREREREKDRRTTGQALAIGFYIDVLLFHEHLWYCT